MKELWLSVLFVLAVVSAIPNEEERQPGENGWYIPQQNGSLILMDREEAEQMVSGLEMRIMGRALDINPANFYLYTQKNPQKPQQIAANSNSIENSDFNPNNPTCFLVHGWRDGVNIEHSQIVRTALLSKGDYNVIFVDWSDARSWNYFSSFVAIEPVGKRLASMIDFLVVNHSMALDTLHVIGHSLGAHIAGYAGKNVKTGQIHSIIGLDPALPLFDYNKPDNRLASTDAFYVEAIHTSGGKLGILRPMGTSDFYPNGGKDQPGCFFDIIGSCAHNLAIIYYAEAIVKNNFPAIKCEGYEQAVQKECGATFSGLRMGDPNNVNQLGGEYFVPVNSKAPYGLGN